MTASECAATRRYSPAMRSRDSWAVAHMSAFGSASVVHPGQRLLEGPPERGAEMTPLDGHEMLDQTEEVRASRHQRSANVVLGEALQLLEQCLTAVPQVVVQVRLRILLGHAEQGGIYDQGIKHLGGITGTAQRSAEGHRGTRHSGTRTGRQPMITVHHPCNMGRPARGFRGHQRSLGHCRQSAHKYPDLHECGSGRVARGGVEPPTFRFSGGRSYQLSYLAGHRPRGPVMERPRRDSNPRPSP